MVCGSTGDWERGLHDAEGAYEDGVAIGNEAVTAEAALHRGYIHLSTGRMEEAGAALDDSIARATASGAVFMQALGMSIKGMWVFLMGDLAGGIELVEAARRIQKRLGDYEGGGMALSFLAQMTFAQGDQAGAVAVFREALASFEMVGDRPEIARLHCEMGWAALGAGDAGEAQRAFQRAVRTYEEVGSPRGTGLALMGLAAVEAAEGRAERAVAIAAASQELSARAGVVIDHPMDPGVEERIEALKASIPKGTLAGLEADARTLSPAAVLAMIGA
jgi:tetratricopeptide (TPR) repeat protein